MNSPQTQHALLRPNIAIPFVLTALIWGSTWFAIKDQLAAAPPSWSVAWRFVLAAAGMAILAAASRQGFRLSRGGHLFAIVFGLSQFSLNFNLLYWSEQYLTSGLVAVFFGLLMLPNAVLARIFLGQEVSRRFLAGTAVAIVGIGLLLLHEARMSPAGSRIELGIGLAAASMLLASAANVMQAGTTGRSQPMFTMLFWAMCWGVAGNVVIALLVAGPPVLPLEPRYLAGVAFLGILGSVVTFPLYFHLIRELGAGRAAYNGVVVPIVAMGWSTLLEDYRWSALSAGGAVLALTGMVLALRARRPSRKVG
ncbi:MAG TPA: DMT family transporter [Sphingomonadaceae bacterium]|nr:DMT family transporter [Sphingomonadaceae bacterium]